MQSEFPPDDMRSLWQCQEPGPAAPPLEELRTRAGQFHSRIFWRNLREYLVSALLIPYFGYCAGTARAPLLRAGNGLLVAGLLYMVYQLHRKASAAPVPADLGGKNCVGFYRAELERQHHALRDVWKWCLGPLAPGLATILTAGCIAGFHRSPLAGIVGSGKTQSNSGGATPAAARRASWSGQLASAGRVTVEVCARSQPLSS